jgi:hypothetical protein
LDAHCRWTQPAAKDIDHLPGELHPSARTGFAFSFMISEARRFSLPPARTNPGNHRKRSKMEIPLIQNQALVSSTLTPFAKKLRCHLEQAQWRYYGKFQPGRLFAHAP